MNILRLSQVFLLLVATVGFAQQSDYEIKERFKTMYESLRHDIDSARTAEQMAQLPNRIKGMESEFSDHATLIGGAFYPKTFQSMIDDLRDQYAAAKDKATTIETQTTRIVELESRLSILNAELDALNTERRELLAKLRSAENSLAVQRDLVRRLNANLASKDRLVNAMVDSIFLPFGKNMDQLTEVQKDAIGKKLEKADIVNRIAGIARDNVEFLTATRLEAKDYSVLVSQYEQFNNRWAGLKEKINASIAASNAMTAARSKKGKATPQTTENTGAEVDAAIADWRSKLDASFWASIKNEFITRGVSVTDFNDAKSFSASIRSFVETAKANGDDPQAFVDEIWVQRIDKDWRAALESESMLGKVEYASLDKVVSQLHKERFDWKILFYIVNIIAVIVVGWWFMTRKPKTAQQATATAKPNV